MRIISGRYKGKKLQGPLGYETTRPTSDRAKEALYNILSNEVRWEGLEVADIFAGSGALGIEALSRGSTSCIFIDKDKTAQGIIRKNIEAIGEAKSSEIRGTIEDIKRSRADKFDIVFMDPPYYSNLLSEALATLIRYKKLKTESLIILEMDKEEELELSEEFHIKDTRIYGKAKFMIIEIAKNI